MTTLDTERFRTALLDERKRVQDALEYIRGEEPRAADDDQQETNLDNHLAENASVTLDQEIDDTLVENSQNLLTEIDAALERIEEGTYGTCVRCGNPIAPERLEATPHASLCIDCKLQDERG
jgi:RNA polymerase-binding protein DksA